MARRKNTDRSSTTSTEKALQDARALQAHLHSLGLGSEVEYRNWCLENGFGRGLHKSPLQRAQEQRLHVRQAADARRQAKRQETRSAGRALRTLRIDTMQLALQRIPAQSSLKRAVSQVLLNRRAKKSLLQLLQHCHVHSRLLRDNRPAIAALGTQAGNTFAEGLVALALHWPAWRRSVETWKPRSHNARRQFASLARHLLADYDVPAFLDAAWFLENSPQAKRYQQWFIHVGQGRNIRKAELPIPYTKRMAHHFLLAPAGYTIPAALRWGQIHGLGGDARLADAICGTRLGESFDHDDFWITVIRFLVANPMLDTVHVGPIADYLQNQRFGHRDVFVAPGVLERQGPPQPNLTMAGRTADSLLRQVHRWHRQLSKESGSGLQWVASGLRGFEFIEGTKASRNMRQWTICELLSAHALNEEGRAMRHCVGSYAGSCARRATSIWTLQLESHEGTERVLTIEVRLANKTLCQARGKYNARPTDKARQIMRRWAMREGLTIASYI